MGRLRSTLNRPHFLTPLLFFAEQNLRLLLDLLLEHLGKWLIPLKFKGEASSPLCGRAHIGCEIRHFRHGNLGLYQLHSLFIRIHPQHPAPAFVDLSEQVSRIRIGNECLEHPDGFQKDGGCLRKSSLIGKRCCHFKRHFRGIDIMIGAVHQCRLAVSYTHLCHHGSCSRRSLHR